MNDVDGLFRVRAWVHYVSANPLNDDQLLLANDVAALLSKLSLAEEALEFYANQKHFQKRIPGVNYDMTQLDWRVSYPYIEAVEYGQKARAALEKIQNKEGAK